MSADKYPSIFLCQMEAIVYLAKTFPDVQRGMSRNSLQNFNKLVGLLINEPVVSEVKGNVAKRCFLSHSIYISRRVSTKLSSTAVKNNQR